jgi:polysaccharide export outer membrane protein
MRLMRRPFVLLAALALVAGVLLAPLQPAHAQSDSSSSDLMDIFQNLSPEQQDTILKQLGGGGGAGLSGLLGGGQSAAGQTGQLGRRGTTDEIQQQRFRPLREGEDADPLNPVLKADDWVIIEVDFHLPPRPLSQSLQSLAPSLLLGQGSSSLSPQQIQAIQSAMASGASPQTAAAQAGLGNPGAAAAAPSAPSGPDLTDEERKRLQGLIDLIRSKDPYQLSRDGELTLPGFAAISLAGLSDDQATLRLKVEPALHNLDIRLTRLPLRKTGLEGLKPFGYDLFDRAPSTFAPVTNVPVPSDYIVGPGDELDIQLYGSQTRTHRLVVDRDGRITLPEIGPINVAGQRFTAVKSEIESRVQRQMMGVNASVSMGDTRSIRVFVLGEARHPGSYTISGLGTITSALYAAGGVERVGSLRKIELRRAGTLVRQLDLYDMLIRGDTTDDAKLLQGDVIFIPPVGATVSVVGEVKRPAIYEVKNESSIADIVQLAGGLTPQADASGAMLTRIDERDLRSVIRVNLGGEPARSQGLRNGDVLRVPHMRSTLDVGLVLEGHVFTPGDYAYTPGMHLSDVIHSVDEVRPDADLHYVLIRRELPPDRHVTVLSADLGAALRAPGSKADVELMARDRITVFDLASGRDRVIQPVLDELRLQGTSAQPTQTIHVEGRVKVPGEYPLEPGMTVADLIRAGGGLADAAYGGNAELSRYQVVNGETRGLELIHIDLSAALRGDPSANIQLQPFDDLSVKELSQWGARQSVLLEGEVRFPGRYTIKNGETLKSVIERAGGLTQFAFPEGSIFTREELKVREQEQLDMLTQRMQTDLATMALQGAAAGLGGSGNTLSVGQSLLGQLKSAKAVGRLVINLPLLMREQLGSSDDVVLRDDDRLIVPKLQQQVTVIGEVQSTTSHLYRPDLSRDEYISLSGGMTRRADHSKIYVVRANGSVVANTGSRWFQQTSVPIRPGDTIVVPLNTEKLPPLPFWQAVTGILYNVAIAAAAVHSF